MVSQLFRAEVFNRQQDHLGVSREWMPAHLHRWVWTWVIATLVIATLLLNQSYADKVGVSGVTQSLDQSALVESPAAGTVTDILVAIGDRVEIGEPLVVVNRSTYLGDGRQKSVVMQDHVAVELAAKQQEISLYRSVRDAERHRRMAELKDAQDQAVLLAQRVDLQTRATSISKAEFLRYEGLAHARLVSDSELQRARSTWVNNRQSLLDQKLKLRGLEQEISELKLVLQAFPLSTDLRMSRLEAEARSLHRQIEDLQEDLSLSIVAPIAGVVADMVVRPGKALRAGSQVAAIRPVQADVRAELYLPARAAASIELGQQVHLQMAAFPYQKHGLAKARIVEFASLNAGAGLPFRAIAEFEVLPSGVRKVPMGMELQGEVILEQTKIWRRLLLPIVVAIQRL